MNLKRKLERNIAIAYANSGLMWGRFFVPVLALFYIASQVTLEQFTIIMGVFSLSILILEVPTGVIADLLGKKKALLASRFFYIIEIAILATMNGFWPFLIAKIISGMGVSLSSGTSQALLYDSLKGLKREHEHKEISGKMHTVSNISMAFIFIVGAYLFSINPKLPAYASLPFITLGFILTFFLTEPYKNKRTLTIKNSLLQLKEGMTYFWHHSYVKYLVFFALPVASAISIMLSMSSAYFEAILIPISLIGVISFLAAMITAYSSKNAYWLEGKLGDKKSFLAVQLVLVLAIGLMSLMLPKAGVFFYFIISLVSGFFAVIINHYVNEHIESSHRATMLSIKNFFIQGTIFVLFPLVGYFTRVRSMGESFSYLTIFLAIYFVGLAIYSKYRLDLTQLKHKGKTSAPKVCSEKQTL